MHTTTIHQILGRTSFEHKQSKQTCKVRSWNFNSGKDKCCISIIVKGILMKVIVMKVIVMKVIVMIVKGYA